MKRREEDDERARCNDEGGGSDGDDDRVVARNTPSISEILSTTVTCMYENSVQYSKYFMT